MQLTGPVRPIISFNTWLTETKAKIDISMNLKEANMACKYHCANVITVS
jgi:hypothetical protein